MATFATLNPDPVGFASWVVVGLVVGLLASWVATGNGYRPTRDLAAGLVGAVAAGYVFGLVTGDVPGTGTAGAVVAFTGTAPSSGRCGRCAGPGRLLNAGQREARPGTRRRSSACCSLYLETWEDSHVKTTQSGDRVLVHYVKRFEDGSVTSSRARGGDPLELTVGTDHPRLPGLGRKLVGLAPGSQVSLAVPAAEAHGVTDPRRVYRLARSRFRGQTLLRASGPGYWTAGGGGVWSAWWKFSTGLWWWTPTTPGPARGSRWRWS